MKFENIIIEEFDFLVTLKEDFENGRVLLHYTDVKGLFKILETGKIEKQWYDFQVNQKYKRNMVDVNTTRYIFKNKDGEDVKFCNDDGTRNEEVWKKYKLGEIACIRPSMSPFKKNMNKEQEKKAGEVFKEITEKNIVAEIILDVESIRDSVKEIKQQPIAEYIVKLKRAIEFYFNQVKDLLDKTNLSHRDKNTTFHQYGFSLLKKIDIFIKGWETRDKVFLQNKIDSFKEKKSKEVYALIELENNLDKAVKEYRKYIKQREGEERLNQDIPLDNNYVQIRLLSNITSVKDFELKKIIKKNSNLFIKNSTYKEFIEKDTFKEACDFYI